MPLRSHSKPAGSSSQLPAIFLVLVLVLVLTLAVVLPAAAQGWMRSYGGPADDTFQTVVGIPGGGSLFAGGTASFGTGGYDALVSRYGPAGDLDWALTCGTPGKDILYAALAIPGGGFLLAGDTADPQTGIEDGWVVEIGAAGNLLGQVAYGTAEQEFVSDIQPAAGGGHLLAGATFFTRNGDIWIFKLDSDGAVGWSYAYGRGDADLEYAYDAVAMPDGGLVVAGSAHYFDGQAIDVDAVVLRVDSQGQVLWHHRFGGENKDEGFGVAVSGDSILIAGSTKSFGDDAGRLWLLLLDLDGHVRWQKTYASPAKAITAGATANGGYLVAGIGPVPDRFDMDLWLMEVDGQGAPIWVRSYGGEREDRALDLFPAADGSLLVAGDTQSFSEGIFDGWALSIPPGGDIGTCCLAGEPPVEALPSSAAVQVVGDPPLTVPLTVRDTSAATAPGQGQVGAQCVAGWGGPPGPVSEPLSGEPPLLVMAGAPGLEVEKDADALAYNVHVDRIGSWYNPRPDKGSLCGITDWMDNGDGTITLDFEPPANSWFVVTASNLCGEGPAGPASAGNERTDAGIWSLCGAAP